MPDVEIRWASEAQAIAERLIPEHHAHLDNEDLVKLLFVFTSQHRATGGKAKLAWTAKLSPFQRFLASGDEESVTAGAQFVITFDEAWWALLDAPQREALVDHELAHVGYDSEHERFVLLAHDLEEFADIVRRHGLWKDDVKVFGRAVEEQLALFDADAQPVAAGV